MDRRTFLRTGTLAGLAGLAGCTGGADPGSDGRGDTIGGETADSTTTTPASDDAAGIYVQPFRERMSMQGTTRAGPYGVALMFTVPHTFWTVTGDTVSKIAKAADDAVHLMAAVWDAETRTVVPETGLSVEITRDGSLVSQEAIYPMLSQPMSFHYGGNFGLGADGTYTVTLSVGAPNTRLTGAFADRLTDPAEATLELAFTEASRSEVVSEPIEQGGQPGALRGMAMDAIPQSTAPSTDALPGTVRGTAVSDGVRFVVTTLSPAAAPVADAAGPYLAVSARTRYNGYVVPAMGLGATLERDGTTVFDGRLRRTLAPDLDYHYGAVVEDVRAGDDLTLSVTTPPQVARHRGYETAMLRFDEPVVTL